MNSLVHKFTVGKWKENCYILCFGKQGIIIDPGDEANAISEFITKNFIKPVAIINTHAHYDHVGAVSELKDIFNIPFYLHSKDKRLLNHASMYRAFVGENVKFKVPEIDYFLEEFETLELGGINLKVFHTPGHTEGSVCFLHENKLFTGDYLLNTKLGRTDLPGANKKKFQESIKFLLTFPPDTLIYPGHGEITSLKNEILGNPELHRLI